MELTSFRTPDVEVTAQLVQDLVRLGGYTHPLFVGPDAPLPGQGVLLLMGGLVEQSGRFDDAIAMVELVGARFQKMVRVGDRLHAVITPGATSTTSSGKTLQEFEWRMQDAAGEPVAIATARMLMRHPIA